MDSGVEAVQVTLDMFTYGRRKYVDSVSNASDENRNAKHGLCRFGRKCVDKLSTCSFSHNMINKKCNYGDRCTKMDTCLFRHDVPVVQKSGILNINKAPGVESNMWLRSKN